MNFFKRTAKGCPTPPSTDTETTLAIPTVVYKSPNVTYNTSTAREVLASPFTPPPTRPSTPSRPTLSSNTSWDTSTLSEPLHLCPTNQNGDAIQNLSSTTSSIHSALSWPHLRDAITCAAESANDTFQDKLNHAFAGHDLPAMHYMVMGLVPSVSMPSMHQFNQGVDVLADKAQAVMQRRRSAEFVEEYLDRDDLSFARHVGAKARRALVVQGICNKWQIMTTKETLKWQARLDSALSRVFREEKNNFSVVELFGMKPIWTGDVASETWRLELDTGLVEVVEERGSEEFGEKRLCLRVDFVLPEIAGCISICDVEREVADLEDWMEVQ